MIHQFSNKLRSFRGVVIFANLVACAPLGATTIFVGTVYDDPGYNFDTFGNNSNGTSRGANFGGASSVTWYGVNMSSDSSGAGGGISWSGLTADATVGEVPGVYDYDAIYFGTPGTGAAANSLTNTGIHSAPTINIPVTTGLTYSIDLLFANAYNARTFDILVEDGLYVDDFAIGLDAGRPLVYRFQFLALDSQIQISFRNGAEPGYTDTNPYVNAMMVTQVVPEPSSFAITATALLGLALRRKR